MKVPFHAVKRKPRQINKIVVFFSSIFWQNEWGWKVFSAHWLYYDMRGSYYIPHVFCYVCMFVVFFAGPSKRYSEQTKTLNQYEHQDPKENFPSHLSPTCLLLHSPCHPLPNRQSQFLNSIKRLWKSGPTETTERPIWLLSSFLSAFCCYFIL